MLRDVRLDVPLVRQVNWCSCGLAAINMAMRYHGIVVTEKGMERNPLVERRYLQKYGFNPGRLGRIALSYGFEVTLIDSDPEVVGRRFAAEGGRWLRRDPNERDIREALEAGTPPVACIPNKIEAFEGSTSTGSHWVTIHSALNGDYRLHDPAPWRRAERCKPGYWKKWSCSLIRLQK